MTARAIYTRRSRCEWPAAVGRDRAMGKFASWRSRPRGQAVRQQPLSRRPVVGQFGSGRQLAVS